MSGRSRSSMAVRIVRLGSSRVRGEGPRIGTVRFPPRGVPAKERASRDLYDVWLPELAPSAELVKAAKSAGTGSLDRRWSAFVKRYRAEMAAPGPAHLLALLAALSRQTDFSVGCHCTDEDRCHRSLLRELLAEAGADVVA